MSDWRDDPALRGLARELRERIGAEFRFDAEDGERLAAQASLRARSLRDVVVDLRSRGDTVAVRLGGRVLTGRVVFVGNDYVRLRTGAGSVDVPLDQPLALRVVERARSGGTGRGDGAATFRARLLQLELDRAAVQVDTAVVGDVLRGRLEAVARDHALLHTQDGQEWVIPFVAIRAVTHADR
ncbi:MAG: hypothetical protein M3N57_03125 [Actinomycetota bacterium]|nr:hypothetical protein [Actinomycetota bacterium]